MVTITLPRAIGGEGPRGPKGDTGATGPKGDTPDVSAKADKSGVNVGPDFVENAPVLRSDAGAIARPISEKLEETLSTADFGGATLRDQWEAAAAAGGLKGKVVNIPSKQSYFLDGQINVQTTWKMDGPVTITQIGSAPYGDLPGKVIQEAGAANPDGSAAVCDPFVVGPWARPGIQEFIDITGRVSPLNTAQMVGYSIFGHGGVLGFTDSADNTNPGYDEGGIALFGVALNRKTGADKKGVYGLYLDVIRYAGAGVSHGFELDNINLGSVVPITPNSPFAGDITTGGWFAAGGGVSGAQTSTVAIGIINNGARWDKGIVFHDIGLADKGGGSGEAIAFGYKHYMAGYNSVGGITSRIHFDGVTPENGTQVYFNDYGVSFLDLITGQTRFNVNKNGFSFGPGGNQWMSYNTTGDIFILGHPTAPVIYATPAGVSIPKNTTLGGPDGGYAFLATVIPGAINYVEVQGATDGNGALIRAQGANESVDLRLQAKGTVGRVQFGTRTATADAPVTGYIEIKDDAGAVRKLAVIA